MRQAVGIARQAVGIAAFALVFTFSAFAAVADFDTSASNPATDSAPAADYNPFAAKRWSGDFTTVFTQPTFLDRHRFVTGSLGLGYAPAAGLILSVEATGDYMAGSGSVGAGGGFDVRGRAEILRVKKISLFVDGSAGIIESDHDLPRDGTHFNFI